MSAGELDLNWYYSFNNHAQQHHSHSQVVQDLHLPPHSHSVNHRVHHSTNTSSNNNHTNNINSNNHQDQPVKEKKMSPKKKSKKNRKESQDTDATANNFNCPFGSCSKIYSSKLGLELHIQAVHEQVRWLCPRCAKEHKFHAALRYHVKTEHPGFRLQKRKDKLSLVPMNSK